jgi:photosystem II stability/assembly factor-like uncharacterized protein
VTALAVNPNNNSNVYLGGADGGLWVTTDAGTTWTDLINNPASATPIPSIAVGALAVDPTTCGAGTICTTVYVGTGEDNFAGDNIYGEGVLKCTVTAGTPPTAACTQDSTFHSPSPLDNTRGGPLVGALVVNPANHAILLAGVRGRGTALQSGIYCSQDSGSTWAPVFGIPLIVGTDAVFASDGTAFVALGFPFGDPNGNNGIYKSKVVVSTCSAVTDVANTTPGGAGSKWTKQMLPAGIPTLSIGRVALGILPSGMSTGANAIIYAAIANSTTTSSNLLGVVKTTNGGGSWTQLLNAPAFCNAQCFFDMVIAVDPFDGTGNTVFAGGGAFHTLIRSTDGGNSWTEVSQVNSGTGLHVDTHALAFTKDGAVLFVGNDGGVWSSATNLTGAGITTWNNLNAQLNVTQFYPGVSIHPSTPFSGLAGSQDNDIQQFNGPNNDIWISQEIGCDGGFTAIDPTTPSTIYGECEYLPNRPPFPIIAVAFTGNQLGNGFLANMGINNADRGAFIPPLVMDLKNPQTLYFGTCLVYQTKDGGATWNAISPDVTNPAHPAGCANAALPSLSTIAVAPSDSNTIYAGAENGEIEVTSNGGAVWTSIATATLPTRSITQIAVDPTNHDIAYILFSGFGSCATFCDGKGHIFKTMNGTAGAATTWVDISVGFPDVPANAVVIDPDDLTHSTLYVGTDIGAFFTINGGGTWSALGAVNTLPNAEILGLALHEPSRTLRAATHGRGAWDLNLGGQATFGITSIAPFTANAGDPAGVPTLTVNGNGFVGGLSQINFLINGASFALTTSCASANQCTAAIPAADIANGGVAQVSVANGASSTSSVPFTVLNPAPTLTSISPSSVAAGANPNGFVITVTGTGFFCGANGTVVLLDNTARQTVSSPACTSTSISAQVTAADQKFGHAFTVDVFNPTPGGGPEINNPANNTLTITGAAFNLSSQPTSGTVTAGNSTTFTIAGNGTSGTIINLLCSVQSPATTSFAPTCSLNPTSVTAGGSPASSTLTVSTTSRAVAPPAPFAWRWPRFMPVPILVAVVLLFAALIYFSRTKRQRSFAGATFALVVLFLVFEAAGCGGGSGGGSHGTPAGAYTITVTGASGGQTNSVNVTLAVN